LARSSFRVCAALQAADKLRAGGHYQDDGYVFAPEMGGHYAPNSLYKIFAQGAKQAGLTLTKLHALRHSFATWLIASGVDVATVSKLLGHSAITTTLRVHAHTLKGAEKTAVGNIDAVLSTCTRNEYGYRMATAEGLASKKP
jgi:integrase